VVQLEAAAGLGQQPFVPGDLGASVEYGQLAGVQQHPDSAPDQPHRHRIAVGVDSDLAEPVHPRGEQRPVSNGEIGRAHV
jgi:hypothetical protein